jgi:hypothetical protein
LGLRIGGTYARGGPPPPVEEKSSWINRHWSFEALRRQSVDFDRRRCHRPGMMRSRLMSRWPEMDAGAAEPAD